MLSASASTQRTTAGRARWRSPPGPATGNQPSSTAKNWIRSTARKKFGMPIARTARNRTPWSSDAVAPPGGENAERDRERVREDRRRHAEGERLRPGSPDDRRDLGAVDDGHPRVSGEDVPQEDEVLDGQRLVKPESLVEVVPDDHRLGRRGDRGHDVAGRDPEPVEDQHRRDQQEDQRVGEPAEDECSHVGSGVDGPEGGYPPGRPR